MKDMANAVAARYDGRQNEAEFGSVSDPITFSLFAVLREYFLDSRRLLRRKLSHAKPRRRKVKSGTLR